MIEFLLAFISNLRDPAAFAGFGLLVLFGTLTGHILICPEAYCDRPAGRRHFVKRVKQGWGIVFACFIFQSLPSMDQIWRARIALVKFELASPKNIEGASETIERIGKKLECKYLGCDEAKK